MSNIYSLKSAIKQIKELKNENEKLKNACNLIKSTANDIHASKEELCRALNFCGEVAREVLDNEKRK